ncbi:MAG: DUF1566 domain-containing protein [Bacteroidia bacterium]|nr:DUF1566 domain-containing protein [Bacteroidia bacterium]
MRRIARPVFYFASLILCFLVLITCIKVEKVVMVSTGSVKNVQANTAIAEGTIVDIGEGVTDHGFVYSTTKDVTMSGTKVALGSKGNTGTFTSDLTNLTAGTTYYIKAYVMGNGGTQLGKEATFKTADPVVPTVTTSAISGITTTTATSGGNVTADGGAPITAKGVCWSTSSGPTVDNSKTTDGQGTGAFTSNLTSLIEGTTYFVRAYATNSAGTGYGTEISFSTVAVVLPTVTTAIVTNISSNWAQGGGTVASDGGAPIINKGVCWSKSSNPTTSDSKTEEGTGTGSFGISFGPLESATLYHVRAYATNSKGTSYGEDLTFTTLPGLPVIATDQITNITGTGATSGGNISNDGGAAIISRGVCWNTSGAPTPDGPKTTDGSGTGVFTSTITGLTTNTKYYVRAYAINSIGISFGAEFNFTTLGITTATLTTTAITSIQKTTAIGGGNITDNGGSTITASGVCWSLNQTPTLADSHTTDNATFGVFNSQLTLLSPGKTYFVRAYATNASGTAYGAQVSFITASDIPTVTTAAPGSITATTADPGGEVSDENGSTVTTRGICYNTVGSPTTNDSKKDEALGKGTYTMSLTGLTPSTTYYARAFAVNGIGTAYGLQIQFTTPAAPAAISTNTITGLASSSVITGGIITSDGGSAVLTRGVVWSTSTAPTTALTSKTNEGSGSGTFISRVSGLLPNTTYNLRAYATNSSGTTFYGNEVTFTTTEQIIYQGYTYNTVKIGTQLWMQENLKATKYRDATDIPLKTVNADWSGMKTGAYSWYGNNPTDGDKYGALYNYFTTVDNKNLCPAGWHVPTDAEWTTMVDYLISNGYNYDGTTSSNKLSKSLSYSFTNEWSTSTVIGAVGNTDYPDKKNASNFSAFPGGYRNSDGTFYVQLLDGYWWSTTAAAVSDAFSRQIDYNTSSPSRIASNIRQGFSVRCIQGEGQVLPAVTTTAISGITSTGAISGGNVTSDGNSAVTEKGVCWSTSSNPTILNSKLADVTVSPSFTSNIGGLSPNTTYYVRAYATNGVGTAYGNEISFITSTLVIGDSYQGGIVAYILQIGDPGYSSTQIHGLIAAPSDQSGGVEWGCNGTTITGADGTALGSGAQNTVDIVTYCTTLGIAAKLCSDLGLNGYSDWYLPSKDELNKLYLNRIAIGGFVNVYYWSSTENSDFTAWFQNFTTGNQNPSTSKSLLQSVRAIRSF